MFFVLQDGQANWNVAERDARECGRILGERTVLHPRGCQLDFRHAVAVPLWEIHRP